MHFTEFMSSHFLYERWLETARSLRNEVALHDCVLERSWTFSQLLAEGEKEGEGHSTVAHLSGNSAQFVINLLRAWRAGTATCPLEAGQSAPNLSRLPDECAHVKLTSASSAAAKCILFSGEQLAADAANIVSTMGLRSDWPNLGCISLAHSYGFSNLVLPLVLHGIPLILLPTPLPETVLRAASAFPAITLPAVPALWKAWHAGKAIPANTRLAISAGAPLPLPLEQEVFEERGLKIHNFYGSSECGGIAYDRTAIPRLDGNCVGSPMENVRLSLSDNQTLIVESSAVGERYWPAGDPSLAKGRFETTDLAEIRDGSVFLRGRVTDLLNVAGRKVSPESIEASLRSHPSVVECVVFGIPDPNQDRTDLVVAVAHLRSKTTASELASFLSERIPAWQMPRQWWFTEELQPNSRVKISLAEWKRRFLEKKSGSKGL